MKGLTRTLKIIITFLFLAIAIFSGFQVLLIVLTLWMRLGGEKSENYEMNIEEYRMVHYDISKEVYTSGFTTLVNRKLENGEFISREKENGDLSIITDFSSEVFLTRGTCFCEGREEQVNRIVSGTNRASAEEKASEIISKVCSEEFEGSLGDVGSRVDSMGERPKDERGLPKYLEHWCKGECVPNPYQVYEELMEKAEKYPCNNYFRGGLVKVFTVNKTMEEMHNEAIEDFAVNILLNYCDRVGKILWERYEEHVDGGEVYKASYESMCWDGYLTEGIIENDSIQCIARI